MRTLLATTICLFCLKLGGQIPPNLSVFEKESARFYAVSGMERVKALDSIWLAVVANDPKRTLGLLDEAAAIIEKAAIPADEKLMRSAKTCLRKGDCFKSRYQFPEAFFWYEKAAAIGARRDSLSGRPNPDRAWAMTSLGRLTGSSLNSSTNFDKAFEYFGKAEPIYLACRDTAGLVQNYDAMASTAFQFHRTEVAVQSSRAGLRLSTGPRAYLVPLFLRRIGDSFLLTEEADSALFYYRKIGAAYDSPDKLVRKAVVVKSMGEAHFIKKDWAAVIAACRSFEELGKKVDIPVGTWSPLCYLWADACYQSGRYKEAYEHMERFKFLEDSILTTTNDAKVAELRERFEADQKEQEIALLRAKNEAQRLWRWLLASLLFIGVAGGWLFFRWFLKKRKAREAALVAENETLQARFDRLLNLHFDQKLEAAGEAADGFLPGLFSILEKNLSNEGFSVESLPHEMGVSRAQFFKKTKDQTGKTPAELLREMRMQKAKRLLAANHTTVAEVAYATGFGSPDSFGRAFKTFFGESPSAAKKGGEWPDRPPQPFDFG